MRRRGRSESAGDSAEEQAPEAQSRGRLLLSLHVPASALGLAMGFSAPVLPVLAHDYGVGIGLATLVFIVHSLGGMITVLPAGMLVDRIGTRKVLVTGPFITAGAWFLIATSNSFGELLAYQFLGGIGTQMWMLARTTVIAEQGSRSRGRQITSMFGVQRIGGLLGPGIGGAAAGIFGLWVPFVLSGMAALVAGAASALIPLQEKPRRKDRAEDGTKEATWSLFLARPIPAVLTGQLLANLTRGGASVTGGGGPIFLYAVYAYGMTAAALGVLTSGLAIAGIPMLFIAGFVMDRFGRKWTIVPALLMMSTSVMVLALTAALDMPKWVFIGTFIWLQVATSFMGGSMQTVATDVAPPQARARFLAVSRVAGDAGTMSNPASFALFSEFAGFGPAFVFRGLMGFVATSVFMFGFKETLRRD